MAWLFVDALLFAYSLDFVADWQYSHVPIVALWHLSSLGEESLSCGFFIVLLSVNIIL